MGIIFVSYALQVRFSPYAASDTTNDLEAVALTPGLRLAYVRRAAYVVLACVARSRLSLGCCALAALHPSAAVFLIDRLVSSGSTVYFHMM